MAGSKEPKNRLKLFTGIGSYDSSSHEVGKMITFCPTKRNQYSSLDVERLYNLTNNRDSSKIKGIGKTLIRYAALQSLEAGLEGRVSVQAAGDRFEDPHFFYWSLGFRPIPEQDRVAKDPVLALIDLNRRSGGSPLSEFYQNYLEKRKLHLSLKRGIPIDQLKDEDIFFTSLSKRMQKVYDKAIGEGRRARWGEGSVHMYLPKEAIEKLLK